MKNVLFVHSAGPQGYKKGSSFLLNYLDQNLLDTHQLYHPQMPDPENPHYRPWKEKLEKEFSRLSNNTILIGHSMGGSTLLKYLSETVTSTTIDGLFLIAAPFWGAANWKVTEYELRRNFSTNLSHIRRVFLYHSKDDNVVPVEHQAIYADQLPGATVRVFDEGGHLFSNGLPELIQDIKSLS
jgi:predicted alpha/beta hydrolase family esterase